MCIIGWKIILRDLENSMNLDLITNIIGISIGVIIGGLITLWVNLYLQKRERKILYAAKNRIDIYEPLYNEVKQKLKFIKEFSNPFDARATLNSWINLKPSEKIRVPDDLKKLNPNGI